jgi:hypothetical protein
MNGADAVREIPPQIAMLREIRDSLRDSLRSAREMQHKLTGPRPATPEQPSKLTMDSVQGMILEIAGLAQDLHRAIYEHHEILGDFGGANQAQMPGGMIGRAG